MVYFNTAAIIMFSFVCFTVFNFAMSQGFVARGKKRVKMAQAVQPKNVAIGGKTALKLVIDSPSNDEESEENKQPETRRNKCCPYNFDSRLCRTVDDRLLCGYNSNQGFPVAKNDNIKQWSNGCRLRGKRVECGYDGMHFAPDADSIDDRPQPDAGYKNKDQSKQELQCVETSKCSIACSGK